MSGHQRTGQAPALGQKPSRSDTDVPEGPVLTLLRAAEQALWLGCTRGKISQLNRSLKNAQRRRQEKGGGGHPPPPCCLSHPWVVRRAQAWHPHTRGTSPTQLLPRLIPVSPGLGTRLPAQRSPPNPSEPEAAGMSPGFTRVGSAACACPSAGGPPSPWGSGYRQDHKTTSGLLTRLCAPVCSEMKLMEAGGPK